MGQPSGWVLDGEVYDDNGNYGGDAQIGPSFYARFLHPDYPGSRYEINMYAIAQDYCQADAPQQPKCPHEGPQKTWTEEMRREHLACAWVPGTVGVEMQCTWRTGGGLNEDGRYESDDSDEILYDSTIGPLGDFPGETLADQVDAATRYAREYRDYWVKNVGDADFFSWDGESKK
jgi:hypothetical protein